MKNLELYGGPADGTLMEMAVVPDPSGGVRRPARLTLQGHVYDISLATEHKNKKPTKGITHIGVYRGNSN